MCSISLYTKMSIQFGRKSCKYPIFFEIVGSSIPNIVVKKFILTPHNPGSCETGLSQSRLKNAFHASHAETLGTVLCAKNIEPFSVLTYVAKSIPYFMRLAKSFESWMRYAFFSAINSNLRRLCITGSTRGTVLCSSHTEPSPPCFCVRDKELSPVFDLF